MNRKNDKDQGSQRSIVVLAMSFGVAAGSAVGAITGDIAQWVAIGVSVGTAAGYVLIWLDQNQNSGKS